MSLTRDLLLANGICPYTSVTCFIYARHSFHIATVANGDKRLYFRGSIGIGERWCALFLESINTTVIIHLHPCKSCLRYWDNSKSKLLLSYRPLSSLWNECHWRKSAEKGKPKHRVLRQAFSRIKSKIRRNSGHRLSLPCYWQRLQYPWKYVIKSMLIYERWDRKQHTPLIANSLNIETLEELISWGSRDSLRGWIRILCHTINPQSKYNLCRR